MPADALFAALMGPDVPHFVASLTPTGITIGPPGPAPVHATHHAALHHQAYWQGVQARLLPAVSAWMATCPWMLAGPDHTATPHDHATLTFVPSTGTHAIFVKPRTWQPKRASESVIAQSKPNQHGAPLLALLHTMPAFQGPFSAYQGFPSKTSKTPIRFMAGSDIDAIHLFRAHQSPGMFWQGKTVPGIPIITRVLEEGLFQEAAHDASARFVRTTPAMAKTALRA